MIRLLEDCDVRRLFKKECPEALRRYWVFSAYSGPLYDFGNDPEDIVDDSLRALDEEGEEAYIKSFQFPGETFVDVGKFDLAFPVFGMDEWTTVIGFVSAPEQAPEIAEFIVTKATRPEEIVARYPTAELMEFLWVDGWWEIFGDIDRAADLVQPDLAFVDTETSVFLNRSHDKESYSKARKELRRKVEERQRAGRG